jgi:hypothetical protein
VFDFEEVTAVDDMILDVLGREYNSVYDSPVVDVALVVVDRKYVSDEKSYELAVVDKVAAVEHDFNVTPIELH